MNTKSRKVEITTGPFDPGGQPDSRTGQPLELSIFGWNVRAGMCGSKAVLADPERYQDYWKWPSSSTLIREADRIGIDGQFQFGMWAGWGGEIGWCTAGLEWSSASAATAAITERIGIVSTVHPLMNYHPTVVAKMGGCLDHVSGGRWALNIVSGQNPDDFRMVGITDLPSSPERYARCDEFTTLMKHLWASDEPIDFEGEYYQAYGARIEPLPVRKPRPVLINAGQSEAGLDFACRQADMIFTAPPGSRLPDYADVINKAHSIAGKHGRRVRAAAMTFGVFDETDAKAERTMRWLEDEIDQEAVSNFVASAIGTSTAAGADPNDEWFGMGREEFVKMGIGLSGYQLVGGYDSIAEQLRALHEIGAEHVCICFLEPREALQQLEEHIIPRLKNMGLRH
jgi:FMNH2-dependent dimethyl sulfone monooxygenase